MKIVDIACQVGETDDLLARLRGRVFHLTTQAAYDAILKSGAILHNKDEKFRLNTSSENSFGRLMGYVCLFDIRNDSSEHIDHVLSCYYFLRPQWFGELQEDGTVWKLAYLILDSNHHDRLIPYAKVHDHHRTTGKFLQAIPNGEVWIEDRIPVDWIEEVLLVTIILP